MAPKTKPKTVGKWPVKCVDFAFDMGDSVKKHLPQVVCRLQIISGDRMGEHLMYYGSLHEACQEYTIGALRALGMTNDDITAPVGLGSRIAKAIERENLYPGAKNKTRIDFIDPFEAPKLKVSHPVSDKNAAATASKFKALFKARPALELTDAVRAPDVVVEKPVTEADSQPADIAESPFG